MINEKNNEGSYDRFVRGICHNAFYFNLTIKVKATKIKTPCE